MTDPISFSSTSPRLGLPMLFSGQSQKEVTVNEALLLADLMLHTVVQGTATTAPATPVSGQCWIVGSGAAGSFTGQDNKIAAWSDGGWRFVTPFAGLRVYDMSRACDRLFAGSWHSVTAPTAPAGGTVIDVQARTAIVALITLLTDNGIISGT